MLLVYSATMFLSAILLFLIQPMFARTVLPMLGGAPAIWNTALVFYQAALLAGYAYAHASTRWLGVRRQSILHLCLMLLAVLALPIGIPAGWNPPTRENPVMWLLALMMIAVGLPFFVVSATSPLLQRWFSATRHKQSSDPYFLYAASNLGSMLALLSYPVIVEPALRLRQQSWLWAAGYGALLILMILSVLLLWQSLRSGVRQSSTDRAAVGSSGSSDIGEHISLPTQGGIQIQGPPASHRWLRWIMLAFVPSSLMMSVTTYVTTDIASVPLLWIIPLAIYLLSFILVFARHPLLPHAWMVKAMPFILLPLVVALAVRAADPIVLVIPLHLAVLFVIAMVCHGELARSRPPAKDLTQFYLYLSIGGVLGGAFNALLAPLLFNGIAEYPIVLTLACFFLPQSTSGSRQRRARLLDFVLPGLLGLLTVVLIMRAREINPNPSLSSAFIMVGLPAIVSLSFLRRPVRLALSVGGLFVAATFLWPEDGKVLYAERSFFGVTKVSRDYSGQFNQILHGNTLHGSQGVNPALRRVPLVYYRFAGPLGQVFEAFNKPATLKNVAIVGLGAGSICCYAKPGQRWTYYEIDPIVARIAMDMRFFTYLKDCEAEVRVVMGDGRLSMAGDSDRVYDLLIMDAYNSDSVPVHLLTREAIQLYLKRLAPRGALVFHISNRYLDLEPVLANLAQNAGLRCLVRTDGGNIMPGSEIGETKSQFLIMGRPAADLSVLSSDPRWVPGKTRPEVGLWTDDYSSILRILKWRR